MKMTFVTDEGVKQEAEIYVVDICEAEDVYPNASATRKAMFMGWHALHRTGVETRPFDQWFATIKDVPDIDMEEVDTPKD